jgi:DNA invertase Pin-like site-specific DNA recombinase
LYGNTCRFGILYGNLQFNVFRMLIGYMRISSTDGKRQNTDLQLDALLKYNVDKRNIYEDLASGSKDDRKGLLEALKYLQKGDTLVVWKLDRLGRSLSHLVKLINELKKREVEFCSLTEGINTSTVSGQLQFHIFASLAEFERSLIQERVNAGLESARRRGRRGGRPKVLDQEKIDHIIESLNDGMSKAAICRNFNVKRSTLIDQP